MSSSDDEDVWGPLHKQSELLAAYDELDAQLVSRIEASLPIPQPSKFQKKKKVEMPPSRTKDDELEDTRRQYDFSKDCVDDSIPSNDDEDDVSKQLHDGEQSRKFFTPSLQVQRNAFVRATLSNFKHTNGPVKKVCIMGCGELSLERYLLTVFPDLGTREVYSVDICKQSMANGMEQMLERIIETQAENQCRSGFPVLYRMFHGLVEKTDARFADADAIVFMEVIEHMPLEKVDEFLENVGRRLQPKMFIFSTPNNDYNEVFGEPPGKFRHSDHHFEFTGKKFEQYVDRLKSYLTNYEFRPIEYIGQVEGFTHLPGATQAVVAVRKHVIPPTETVDQRTYKMVAQYASNTYFKILRRNVLKSAVRRFLKEFDFARSKLDTQNFSPCWCVPMTEFIKEFVETSESFKSRLVPSICAEVIKTMTHLHINYFEENDEVFLIINEKRTRDQILSTLS